MNIIPFNYGDSAIRVLKDEKTSEPLWVAKDVCDVLELKDVNRSCSKLDDDEKLMLKVCVSGQNREMICINESGLYSLIFRSNKQEAKPFKRWVTHEVLPSIRKNGNYLNDDMKEQLEKIVPKGGFLEENAKGDLKSKLVRAYYRADNNTPLGKLLAKKHQLQKRLNGFFIEEIKFELDELEADIAELAEEVGA
jgi:prophage antirepressor-like protein